MEDIILTAQHRQRCDKTAQCRPDSWFSANRKAQIMGEARFMRALCHYNLLRWYAQYWDTSSPYGVLLRTEPVLAGSIPKSRSSVKDSYSLILEDLDYAIDNAPAENPNYYASSWTAKGLKARVLMMRGEGTDYADAEALCKDIIDNGPFELEQHTEDIFYQKGLESKEVIFGIQPKDGQTNVFEAYYYRGISNYYPTTPFYALFDDKDPRKSRLFLIKDKLNSMGLVAGMDTLICKHINPEKITSNTIEESQYQMRLTEMYLLRAEAIVRHDPSRLDEARELLRTVLTHSQAENIYKIDAANTPDALLAEIFHEMLRNLFCESGRELEIMMRMPREAVIPINEFRDTPNFMIFPVPADEFRYNPLFGEQNPGYGKV